MLFSQNNFAIWWQSRDKFSSTTSYPGRVGDKGETSENYVKRAYDQFKQHDWHDLAKTQDEWTHPDPIEGSPDRVNNRNYKRMEYDFPQRDDGKGQSDVIKDVYAKNEMNVKAILDAFKKQGWTQNNTASTVSWKPIEKSEYDNQMTTDK
jgi:hypothetical protein